MHLQRRRITGLVCGIGVVGGIALAFYAAHQKIAQATPASMQQTTAPFKTTPGKAVASPPATAFSIRSSPQRGARHQRNSSDRHLDASLIEAAGVARLKDVKFALAQDADPNARDEGAGQSALWVAADADLSESGDYAIPPKPPTPAQRRAWTTAYVGIIHELLAHGANPDLADQSGITPLAVAAFRGRQEEAAALLQGGANPNSCDQMGKRPIEWAAYNGYSSVVALLRAHGAYITRWGLPGAQQRAKDQALYQALLNNNLQGVKEALAQGANASAHINELLSLRADEAPEMSNLIIPLIYATDSPAITRLLLAHGADVNGRDWTGNTALIQAANGYAQVTSSDPTRRAEVVAILLAHGAQVNVHDNNGETPLAGATASMTRLLLAKGARVNVHNDDNGITPLMAAPDAETVRLLLAQGANINARTHDGSTVIHYCNDADALRVLIAHGANINAQNHKGRTALMDDATVTTGEGDVPSCDLEGALMLLRQGANPNIQDKEGNTALMLLASQGEENLGDAKGFTRALLQHGTRLSLRNRYGRTALQVARRYGALSITRLFEQRGLHRSSSGHTGTHDG